MDVPCLLKLMMMLQKIRTGWNVQRIFYLLAGTGIMVSSIIDGQWIGMLLGGYFTAMGFFGFGCAAGNCCGGACDTPAKIKD